MKRLLLFAMAIIFAMQLSAQTTVVVGDTNTSTTSSYVPCYLLYTSAFTESVYPASALSPGMITTLSYYHNGSAFSNGTVSIYMKEVDNNTLTSYIVGEDDFTLVYTGPATYTSGRMDYELTSPFVYTGSGNLLIAYIRNGTDWDGSHTWKTTSGSSIYKYADNVTYSINTAPSSPSTTSSVPVIKLEMQDLEGFCYSPSDVTVATETIGIDEATVTWETTDESSTTFGVAYKALTDEEWITLSENVTDLTYTISGLDPYTRYQVKIWTICDENTSNEKIANFVTLPTSDNYIEIPYEQNFDDLEDLLSWDLWTVTNNNVNNWNLGELGANLSGLDEGSEGKGLYISNDGGMTNSYSHVSTSSHLSTLINIEEGAYYGIEFDYRAVGELDWDEVTVSLYPLGEDLPASNSTSHMIGRSYSNTNQWTRVAIPFPNDLEPTVYQLVISWRNDSGGGSDPAASIDNLYIFSTPCARVNQFETAMEDADGSATMIVTVTDEMNEGAEYIVEYRYAGDTTWYSEQSESPISITGLPYSSKVEYRVTASCAGDLAVMSDVFTDWTTCNSITEFPYVENFDENVFISAQDLNRANRSSLHCWYNVHGGSSYYWSSIYSGAGLPAANPDDPTAEGAATKALYFYGTSYTTTSSFSEWMISPVFELTGNERLNFQYRITSTTNSPVIDVYAMDVSENDYTAMADTANFTLIGTINTAGATVGEYDMAEVFLNEYEGNTRVALAVRQVSSTFYIDNFTISEIPACPDVYGLQVTPADHSVYVNYNTANVESGVVIAYAEFVEGEEFDPESAETVSISNEDELPYQITDLTEGTTYIFAAQQSCGGAWSETVTATVPIIYTLPQSFDFDTPETTPVVEFTSTTVNVWTIGTAENNTVDESGTPTEGGAMYVSNNNGATASYNSNLTTTAYASIPFNVEPTGEIRISFDWKCVGEGSTYNIWDYMDVKLVADGQLYSSGITVASSLYLTPTWQTVNVTVPAGGLEGIYRLMFRWYNDSGSTDGIPGVVDNISITTVNCTPMAMQTNVSFIETEESETGGALVVNMTDEVNTDATYVLRYKASGATEWTEFAELTPEDFPYTILGINFQTLYNIQMGIVCDGSDAEFGDQSNIQTPCQAVAAPWSEDFTADPFTSTCWERYVGVLPSTGVVSSANLTSSSYWSRSTRTFNGESVQGARVNIYSTNCGRWFVTPNINLGEDTETIYQLGFDVALTDYNNANLPEGPSPDDRLIVFISRDGGATWDINNALVFADGDEDTEHNYADLTNVFQRHIIKLADENDEPYTGTVRFAFYGESTVNNADNDLWIDNIIVDEWSSCPNPYSVRVSDITSTTAEATFSAFGTSAWEYVVVEGEDADPDSGEAVELATTDAIELTELTPGTIYTFAVRSVCEDETSNWITFTFNTLAEPASLPYFTSFDEVDGWFVSNATTSTSGNAWAIGSATAYDDGGSAAYISNDGGESYAATLGSATTITHLWKDFDFGETSDEFELAFDWKGIGRQTESSYYCYLGVFITDLTPLPETSTVGASYRVVRLAGAEDWQSERIYLGNRTGQKRVIFTVYGYTNDTELSVPMAIDNVNLLALTCTPPAMSSVSVSAVTESTATITWTDDDESHTSWAVYYKAEDEEEWSMVTSTEQTIGLVDLLPGSNYSVYVTTVCEDGESVATNQASFRTRCLAVTEFPFFESFEDINNLCWTSSTIANNYLWELTDEANGNNAEETPSHGQYMAYHTWSEGQSARLESPVFDLSSMSYPYIKFDYQLLSYMGTAEDMTVKYRATQEDAWTTLATYSSITNGWTTDSIALPDPSSTYQIGFESVGVDGYGVVVDAIYVYDAEEGGVEPPVSDPCDAPTALTANNITETTADIIWTGTATSYEVRLNAGAATAVTGTTKQYTGLTPNTDYTVEVRAVCGTETSEWVSVEFTTLEEEVVVVTPPTVATLAATEVTHESAVLNGTITSGNETITAQGFMYKANAAANWTTVAATGANITTTVTSLAAETTYSFKAFATTASGTVEGTVMTFTTTAAPVVVVAPTVATLAATAVDHESAVLNGTITAGSETITAQGFMYKATAAADWTTVNATGTTISATLSALTAETEYTFKAFATTASGTVEGTAMTFTTTAAPIVAPVVTTLAATAVDHESATLNGTITAGSETITAQGFMYKATAAADWTTVNATGETITATLSALTAETEYTFKAFATTASGTVEGTAMTFTTTAAPIVAPVVTTLAATEITNATAKLNGTVTAGSEEIVAQGFMYKASNAADWTTVAAVGETMTLTVEGLEAELEYVFKAFATTASGTVEGEELTFTTLAGLNDATAVSIIASVYPNPAEDKATISVNGLMNATKIVVSDMQGRILLSDDMTESTYELNTSNYASGVYYIRIISGNAVNTQKLIVK